MLQLCNWRHPGTSAAGACWNPGGTVSSTAAKPVAPDAHLGDRELRTRMQECASSSSPGCIGRCLQISREQPEYNDARWCSSLGDICRQTIVSDRLKG